MYSLVMGVNSENYELDYYKKYSEEINQISEICKKSKELGVNQFEKSIDLEDIFKLVNKNSVPIILLDWSILDDSLNGYNGHFVPVVGFDDEYVYVHTGHKNQEYFPISKELFDKARKSKGTDEDLIVVSID